jgi:beta-glucosidase
MAMPEGFGWGCGASAEAVEGPSPASDRLAFDPGAVRAESAQILRPATIADDLRLLAEQGLGQLRWTVDWSRLEPEPGRPDPAAVEHQRAVLTAARDAGLDVWACLHDGSLPGWFSVDEHGFGDARARRYFWARHVESVGEHLGDLVAGWIPVFEPSRWALRGWVTGSASPGRRDDARGFAEALEGAQLAAVEAALRLRGGGRPVASAQWLVPVFAARLDPDAPPDPQAEAMASVVDEALWGSWRRLLAEQTLVCGLRPPVEVPGAREAFDVLGFTYRHAVAVRADGALLPYPQALATGPDGQVPWAEGFGLVLHRLAEAFPDRDLLAAGVGLTTGDEGRREDFVRDLVGIADDAANGGMRLRGLWWNTPIDPAPGLVGPGLFDHERAPRPAAALLGA